VRKSSGRLAGLAMSAEGKGQVGHAGGVHLQVLAERVGRGEELTYAMRRTGFAPRHERGRVLTDLACAIVLGAVAIADIAVLEHQRPVLTDTASASTVWRTLEETGELQLPTGETGTVGGGSIGGPLAQISRSFSRSPIGNSRMKLKAVDRARYGSRNSTVEHPRSRPRRAPRSPSPRERLTHQLHTADPGSGL
jgi:hypothetical protein